MKIVAIKSSPRGKASNSNMAMDAALSVAKENGADIVEFDISKLEISDCHGDNYCKMHDGMCAVDDDMQPIYDAIKECDGLIIASPIYFFNVTGKMRAFIDRLYAFGLDFCEKFGSKKFSLIISQGMPDEDAFKPAIGIVTKAFETLGFDVVDVEVFGGSNEPVSLDDDQIKRAENIGSNII